MNPERITKKPRVKGFSRGRCGGFWCFYHKRFFDEDKKVNHCIPKQCYEFDYDHYQTRLIKETELKQGMEEAKGEGNLMEVKRKKIILKLTEYQRRVIEDAVGRDVKEILIKPDSLYFMKAQERGEGCRALAFAADAVDV